MGVGATEAVAGAFDHHQLRRDALLFERPVNPSTVAQGNECVFVAMNEQRGRIVGRDVDDGRDPLGQVGIELEGRESVVGSDGPAKVDGRAEPPGFASILLVRKLPVIRTGSV